VAAGRAQYRGLETPWFKTFRHCNVLFFAGKAGIRCCSETTGHVCFAGGAQHQKGLYKKVHCLKAQYVVEVRKDQSVSTAEFVNF
jgi:hypothetical protein